MIVTLPEATPVFEATRLREDLERAGISSKWWVANQCLSLVQTNDPILAARAEKEKGWLNRIADISGNHMAAVAWQEEASPERIGKSS